MKSVRECTECRETQRQSFFGMCALRKGCAVGLCAQTWSLSRRWARGIRRVDVLSGGNGGCTSRPAARPLRGGDANRIAWNRSAANLSRGCARSKTRSLHPWLQTGAPAGAGARAGRIVVVRGFGRTHGHACRHVGQSREGARGWCAEAQLSPSKATARAVARRGRAERPACRATGMGRR